ANSMVGSNPDAETTGYFNRDGNLDLATANSASNTVSVLLGNGDGTFRPADNQHTYAVGRFPDAIATGDLLNDSVQDIVTANGDDGTVSVLLGRGDGTFLPALSYQVAEFPTAVAVGDVNGDGIPD